MNNSSKYKASDFLNISIITLLLLSFSFMLTSCQNKADGQTVGNSIENLKALGFVSHDKKYVYYTSFIDNQASFVKMDSKGNKFPIIQTTCLYVNVLDDKIYYVDGGDYNIYKIDSEGGDAEKLCNLETSFLYAYNDLLYMIARVNEESESRIYTMRLDGSGLTVLSDEDAKDFYVIDKSIYYSTFESSQTSFFKMDLDGNNKVEIISELNESAYWFIVHNDKIFYLSKIEGGEIKSINIKDKSVQTLVSQPIEDHLYNVILPTLVNCYEDKIIYIDIAQRTLKHINLDTGEIQVFNMVFENEESAPTFYRHPSMMFALNNKIYYYQNNKFYMMDLDGKNNTKIL